MKKINQARHKQNLGKYGESLAASFLGKKGYHIIEQNFKARYGEIDIIAKKGETLVFIEVKTRIGKRFGTPQESITPKKIRELIKTAEYYCLLHPHLPKQLRIDVVALKLTPEKSVETMEHIQNVTGY